MFRSSISFLFIIILIIFTGSVSAASDNEYDNERFLLKKTERASQPKYYCAIGASYPLYLDISNRAKNGDFESGLMLSKPDRKFFYSAAAGMRTSFNDRLSFEVETILYRGMSSTKSSLGDTFQTKLESLSLFLNSYYILDGKGGFHPFFGAGIGFSYNSLNDRIIRPASGYSSTLELLDKSKIAPSAQAIFGVSKKISDNFDIQVKVKAMSLGKFSVDKSEGRLKSIALSGDVGFKYSFNQLKRIRKTLEGK